MNLRNKSKWYLAAAAAFCLICVYGITRYYQNILITEAEDNIRSHGYKVRNHNTSEADGQRLKQIFPKADLAKLSDGTIGISRHDLQESCNVTDIVSDLKILSPLISDFNCGGAKAGDQEAAIIGQMHQLTRLSFDGTDLTDAGAQSLSNLKKLGWLSIHAPQITDKGMSWISQFPDLWRIYLTDAKIGGGTIKALSNLPKLDTVYLYSSTIHSSDLRYLKNLKELRWLVLEDTKIDDKAATYFKPLNSIETLELGQTQVGDAVCEAITNIENLRKLRLNETAITDKGVRAILEGCQHLEELSIRNCNITANAFSDLKTWPSKLETLLVAETMLTGPEVLQIYRDHPTLKSVGYSAKDMEPGIREQIQAIREERHQKDK